MSRRARRSLAEFTMPAAASAIVEPLWSTQPSPSVPPPRAARKNHAPRLKIAAKKKQPAHERAKKAHEKIQASAASTAPQTKTTNGADSDGNNLLDAVGEVTSVAAKAAKDYRTWIFEHMKSNMTAGLAYASGLAGLPAAADAHSENLKQVKDRDASGSEQHHSASAKITAEFCGKAFELMTANLNATVEYAQRLGDVKSPSEFVELSTSHARKHVELVITQAVALGAFSQVLSETSAEQLNADIAKAFDG